MEPADEVADILGRWREEAEHGRYIEPDSLLESHPEHAEALADGLEMQGLVDQYFAEEDALPFLTPERLGDYRIVQEIGRGGMGVVYEAEQESMQRRVALKVLYPTIATTVRTRKRFEREARLTGRLHHTNIVTVHAMGRQDGYFYFVMELVEGRPLDRIVQALRELQDGDPLSETLEGTAAELRGRGSHQRIARMAGGVADALQVAHAQGVIHRDVKPSNLVLDEDGVLKLTDFGLAHLVGEDLGVTRTGEAIGTPRYMSPEQVRARREDVDHRTDVYSLGATLYELLTLRPLHDGADIGTLCSQILKDEAVPLRQIDPSIPKDLATIVEKALQKERGDRYASVEDMAYDLRAFSEGRSIRARPVGRVTRAWRTVKRHRVRSALTVGLLTLGAVAVWLVISLRAADDERRDTAYQAMLEKHAATIVSSLSFEFGGDIDSGVLFLQKPLDESRAILAEAIELDPSRPEAYAERASLPGPAVERLRDADHARARGLTERTYHFLRQRIYSRDGQKKKSDTEGELALAAPPDGNPTGFLYEASARRNEGDVAGAISVVGRAIDALPEMSVLRRVCQYTRARWRLQGGDLVGAVEDLSRIETSNPYGRAQLDIQKAVLWRRLGEDERAEKQFSKLLQRVLESHDTHFQDAVIQGLEKTGERHWVDRVSRSMLKRFPERTDVLAWRATYLARAHPKYIPEALRLVRKATSLETEVAGLWMTQASILLMARDSAGARDAYAQVLRLEPENRDARVGKALAELTPANFDSVRSTIEEAIRQEPRNHQFRLSLASLLWRKGDLVEAEESLAKAVELAPLDPVLAAQRARLLFQLKRYPEALAACEAALSFMPKHAATLNYRGVVLQAMGKYPEALEAYEATLAVEPGQYSAQLNAGAILFFRLRRYREARDAFQRCVEHESATHDAWRMLAFANLRLYDYEAALAASTRAVQMKPDNFQVLHTHAEILDALGRSDQAIGLSQKLTSMSWHSSMGHRRLAVALVNAERIEEALGVIEEAFKRYPKDRVRLLLAKAASLLRLRREEEARKTLLEAKDLDPAPLSPFQRVLLAHGVGDHERADALMRETGDPKTYAEYVDWAEHEAMSGDTAQALLFLERAIEEGYRVPAHAPRDIFLRSIWDHPQYKALRKRMLLPPAGQPAARVK